MFGVLPALRFSEVRRLMRSLLGFPPRRIHQDPGLTVPHSPKYAQRLISELEPFLPDGAERVLERPSYWDAGVCDRFFERCEDLIFHDPHAGLKLAEVAPRYVRTLAEGDSPKERREHRGRIVRAYALLGAAYRGVGRLDRASEPYQTALEVCASKDVPAQSRADLFLKIAGLRAYQSRFGEAHALIDRALRLAEAHDDVQGRAMALAVRGAVYALELRFSEAVVILSEVVGGYRLTDRVEYSVTGNLAYAVGEADDSDDLETAMVHLRQAHKLSGPRKTVKKGMLYWIEAMILLRRDSKRAEKRLRKAWETFLRFDAGYELALVGLDLSALLRFQKRWTELEKLAADTCARFREIREDKEALAALRLWLEASEARNLTEELLADVKARVKARRPGSKSV